MSPQVITFKVANCDLRKITIVKNKTKTTTIIPTERIIGKIYLLRGEKVIFDRDLAELYGVETRVLKQAVKRNIKRFPEDFMFRLNKKELEIWRSQIVMSKSDLKGLRWLPIVFTEQGVAMLSSVLKSSRAINVNIQIMRTFTQMRKMLATNKELREKIEKMEQKYDKNFKIVFQVIAKFLRTDPKDSELKVIGFLDKRK